MADEWGKWQTHDGSGCPCVGQLVHTRYGFDYHSGQHPIFQDGGFDGDESPISNCESISVAMESPSWNWAVGWFPIVEYRIRRPKALIDMIERAESLPVIAPEYEGVQS